VNYNNNREIKAKHDN